MWEPVQNSWVTPHPSAITLPNDYSNSNANSSFFRQAVGSFTPHVHVACPIYCLHNWSFSTTDCTAITWFTTAYNSISLSAHTWTPEEVAVGLLLLPPHNMDTFFMQHLWQWQWQFQQTQAGDISVPTPHFATQKHMQYMQCEPHTTTKCAYTGFHGTHLPHFLHLKPTLWVLANCCVYTTVPTLSGDTCFQPSPSCSIAMHRFPMSDPHHAPLSDLGAHHTYHRLYHVMLHLHIYCVPMFLDLACVWQLTWWLGTVQLGYIHVAYPSWGFP